jgi:Protein of unknown function (DUF3667)
MQRSDPEPSVARQPAPGLLLPAGALHECANCGTPGSGRYCGSCGQRLDVHLHSLGHFTSEAAEVLTHSDSSLWATLLPLLRRPGWLTREFVAGRRARYLHPFRLYLVASLLAWLASHAVGLGAEPRVSDARTATGLVSLVVERESSPTVLVPSENVWSPSVHYGSADGYRTRGSSFPSC